MLAAATLLLAGPFVAGYLLSQPDRATAPVAVPSLVDEVREALAARYYRSVPADVLQLGSVNEMLSALRDPYTSYLDPPNYRLVRRDTAAAYSGIGIGVLPTAKGLVVASVARPARLAGRPCRRHHRRHRRPHRGGARRGAGRCAHRRPARDARPPPAAASRRHARRRRDPRPRAAADRAGAAALVRRLPVGRHPARGLPFLRGHARRPGSPAAAAARGEGLRPRPARRPRRAPEPGGRRVLALPRSRRHRVALRRALTSTRSSTRSPTSSRVSRSSCSSTGTRRARPRSSLRR